MTRFVILILYSCFSKALDLPTSKYLNRPIALEGMVTSNIQKF
jgi:hypothetical protein